VTEKVRRRVVESGAVEHRHQGEDCSDGFHGRSSQ
jgi:hypothetical protein